MADRSSIAFRIGRLLESGWELATLFARLDISKDSEASRALTNLNTLLGILRSLRPALQSREFQTRIGEHVLQTLDDTVLRCDEILRDIQEDIQEEKNMHMRNRTGIPRTAAHRQSTWQSLSSRMADESSHLLFALHQILPAEGQESLNLNPSFAESRFREETYQPRSVLVGDAESDSLATQEDSQQPSGCLVPLVNSDFERWDSTHNKRVQPALGHVSAIGELIQMILEHTSPNNLCSLIPQQDDQSSSLRATSPPAKNNIPVERFLLDLQTETRTLDDLQGLITFLRSNTDIILREYERYSISQGLGTKLDMNARSTPESNTGEELHEQDDRFFWPTMRLYRDFIKSSDAFQRLREATNPYMDGSDNQLEDGSEERTIRINLSLFFRGLVSPLADLTKQSHIYRRTLRIFSDIGLIESAPPPGCVRFRWRNRHGKVLYDDYIENEPASLRRLRQYFDGYYTLPVKTANEESQGQRIPDSASLNTPTSRSSFPAYGSSGTTAVTPPSTFTGVNGITSTDIEKALTHSRTRMLLLCIERSGHPDTLHQEIITDILDDNQLFQRLRHVYREHIGKLKSFWSLRTLGSIQFMKFIYEGHPHIDVRCHNDLCEKGRCICVPPADLVAPKGSEYDCSPIPPGLSPPVGSKHMMDLFHDPGGYRAGATRVIQQIPKRVNEGLKESSNGPVEAWGICFKEDWNRLKIWWLIMIVFLLSSLIFGILWGILQKDVEGAFGIAGWWMTGATVFIGIIGIYS